MKRLLKNIWYGFLISLLPLTLLSGTVLVAVNDPKLAERLAQVGATFAIILGLVKSFLAGIKYFCEKGEG